MIPRASLSEAAWIWTPHYDDATDPAKLVLFRKSFTLETLPETPFTVHVSADTRYRLFVNGERVSFGPCKSYLSRWYYETVDILPCLKVGPNVISAKVLRFSSAQPGNSSMVQAHIPGFFLFARNEDIVLHTDTSWKTKEDPSFQIIPRSEWNSVLGPPFLSLNERIDNARAEPDWTSVDFDDSHWLQAVIRSGRSKLMPTLEPRRLSERPIPPLPEIEKRFQSVVQAQGAVSLATWNAFLSTETPVTIPPNTSVTVEMQTEILTTGFLQLRCSGTESASIDIMCAESYEKRLDPPVPCRPSRWKGDRSDYRNGVLMGLTDELRTSCGSNYYEPFWFRTFRYVQLHVRTADSPLTLQSFTFRETHYPLEIQTNICLSPEMDQMWNISLNTLRNCMHETYEDCPFYEQNQFLMDSRLEILFTYQLSRDDRLARKCMQEFYASRREDGLLETHFPVPYRNINIPQFSLHWILMIHDHMMYFGDKALVKQYVGAIDGILDHFDRRVTARGLVGRFDDEAWAFVDWVSEWQGTGTGLVRAMPRAYHINHGEVSYNSLIYSMTLQRAADICDYVGRYDTSREYRARAASINEAVNARCFNGKAYLDGPGSSDICQHSQIFAILAGAISGRAAWKLMRWTLENKSLPRCSYAMSFYVLRAASLTGVYTEEIERLMHPWTSMVADNMTTWAEDDVMFRSDCHGWSASPLYELVAEIFGITPADPGYRKIRIAPRYELLRSEASGQFTIPLGTLSIFWDMNQGLTVTSTVEVEVNFVLRTGQLDKRTLYPNTPITIE